MIDPFSGETVCELPKDTAADLETKLDAAVAAQRVWAELPVAERAAQVGRALGWFRDHGEQVALDITRQMGKPIAQSRNELGGLFERAEHMLAIAEDALAPEVLPEKPGFERRIEHVPLGVVLDIAAWNYPLVITINVLVPALLAGNAVVVKHSERTPLCGRHFTQAFASLEPAGLVCDAILDHPDTARLVGDPRIDHVSFTGSVEGGRQVQSAARERFIDVGLELGGKDAAYLAEDADLETAVAGVVDGACYNAGQSCCGVERIYVPTDRLDEVVERARPLLEAYTLADPKLDDTTMGPLANPGALDLLEGQVAAAVQGGAQLLLGGARVERCFFPPTLVVGAADDSSLMRDESFGPIVAITPVTDDADALRRMNDSDLGLTASVWTADADRAEWFARRLDVGTVFQNRCDSLDPALPWTGVKNSGRGSTLSTHGFHHLTRRKSLHFKRS